MWYSSLISYLDFFLNSALMRPIPTVFPYLFIFYFCILIFFFNAICKRFSFHDFMHKVNIISACDMWEYRWHDDDWSFGVENTSLNSDKGWSFWLHIYFFSCLWFIILLINQFMILTNFVAEIVKIKRYKKGWIYIFFKIRQIYLLRRDLRFRLNF